MKGEEAVVQYCQSETTGEIGWKGKVLDVTEEVRVVRDG